MEIVNVALWRYLAPLALVASIASSGLGQATTKPRSSMPGHAAARQEKPPSPMRGHAAGPRKRAEPLKPEHLKHQKAALNALEAGYTQAFSAPSIDTAAQLEKLRVNVMPFSDQLTEALDLRKALNPQDFFQEPMVIRSRDGYLTTRLVVDYSDPSKTLIYNPIKKVYNKLKLRTYNGRLTGPTLVARPGDTLLITVEDRLPLNQSEDTGSHLHDLNSTNLHTHGLHVSPSGNSDNVLLQIDPGVTVEYEIKIPKDHPAGTFWYHAHKHGSVGVQTSSGMAGAHHRGRAGRCAGDRGGGE